MGGGFAPTLSPALTLAVFGSTAVLFGAGYVFHRDDTTRKAVLTAVILGFVVVNLLGVTLLPLASVQKFTPTAPAETSDIEVRAVDGSGDELTLDSETVTPAISGRGVFPGRFVGLSQQEKDDLSEYLFQAATERREEVVTGGRATSDDVYPDYIGGPEWTSDTVSDYGPFVGIRFYRVTTTFDGEENTVSKQTRVIHSWMSPSGDRSQ